MPYPVQFRVVGPEASQVRAYADEVKAIMRANPNLRGVNDNWNESVKALHLDVDQDKARALGVTSSGLSQAARIVNGGNTIGQYRDGDKLIDIVLRQPAPPARGDHRPGQRLRADGQRQERPARPDRHGRASPGSRASSGATAATTRSRCRATSSRACRARP